MTRTRSTDGRYDSNHGRSHGSRASYREQSLPPPPPRPQEYKSSVTGSRPARSSKRRAWPPQPMVEDEGISLAKEYPRPKVHSVRSDEVRMRGTVNQDPILIELDNPDERRFVIVSNDDELQKQDESGPLPKQQARNSRHKRPDQQPALKLDLETPDILAPRQPSPYAFTRASKTSSNRNSQEFFLSPDNITPPKSTISKQPSQKDLHENVRKQDRRDRRRDNHSRSEASDESDIDAALLARLRARETKPRVSFHEPRKDRSNRYSSDLSDYEDPRSARPPIPIPSYHAETRAPLNPPRLRPSNSYQDIGDERIPSRGRPIPVPMSHRSDSVYTSRPSRNELVQPGSPSSSDTFFETPPGSPMLTPWMSTSKPVARTTSRPSSPVAVGFDLNQGSFSLPSGQSSQANRSSTYPPSSQQRAARTTSKLSSSVRQESVETLKADPRFDVQSPSPVRPANKPPLPYPDDEPDILMPSHEAYQVRSDGLSAPFKARTISRPPSVTSTTPSWNTSTSRPTMASRHSSMNQDVPRARAETLRTNSYQSTTSPTSYHNTIPSQSLDTPSVASTQTSYAQSTAPTQTSYPQSAIPSQPCSKPCIPSLTSAASTATMVPVTLSPCPRREFSSKYDDWYTLDGAPSFNVCPQCIDEIVRPTVFRGYFKRATSRPANVRTRCHFGSPWTRLAWLLILKRQRKDLGLIYALAEISEKEPECPGTRDCPGKWYGLRGEGRTFKPNFAICSSDTHSLEALFPSLLGTFVRLPDSGSRPTPRTCSLRTESQRWNQYLDLMVAIDDKARAGRVMIPPDLTPLENLLDTHAYKMECQRDRIILDQTWHFIPTLSDFTVCEECFESVVLPVIDSGDSALANHFHKVLMPLPPSATKQFGGGASCQLYSPRMRRAWERAVRYGGEEGYRYLARKVRERKDVHQELLMRQVDIGKKLGERGVDKERLRRELERIEREWGEWE
ncbi:Protein phosphatase PP2A regulatory subunit A [Venturia nashicola]|uniref:Protein phosphatase PP2A regulatory subunit A n=1 Tax=Venturia nashicola TaxID=86259 RepID=A0A4Z1PKS7_9PEZI|nr:Protein phosphatase PP2A regulatory subunit A [Venturia nashicola]